MSANIDVQDIPSLVNRIAWMVRRVSEGQQLDIEFENRERVTEPEYLEMIEGKTAVMFHICAELGARVAGADEEVIECLADWGLSVGLCFQLIDDVQNFAVMFFNRHLEIQPGELAQVAVRVTVFRAKDRSNFKNAAKIRHDSHLFIQLRRLRQARRLSHVIQLEHARTAFGGA